MLVFSLWHPTFVPISGCGISKEVPKIHIRPSHRLLIDASHYKKLVMGSDSYTAVMLRSEHARNQIKNCLAKTLHVMQELQVPDALPFVAADIGTYGSKFFFPNGNLNLCIKMSQL